MQVSIRYFTSLRELTGKKEEKLSFPEDQITVDLALKTLSKKYGKNFDDYIYNKNGQTKSFLQFLINGNNVSTLERLESTLRDGDVLAILPPIGGG